MNRWRIQVGLPKPETAQEVKDAASIEGMRRAIQFGRRDSRIIAAALEQAVHMGLNGEDTYVLLAYHALLSVESYARRCIDLTNLMPMPPMIIDRPSDPTSGPQP